MEWYTVNIRDFHVLIIQFLTTEQLLGNDALNTGSSDPVEWSRHSKIIDFVDWRKKIECTNENYVWFIYFCFALGTSIFHTHGL